MLAALEGVPAQPKTERLAAPSDDVRAQAEQLVLRLLAFELKLPEHEIAVTEPFDHYGVDSLITMSLTRQLEEHFGPLSKTLLFEHVTVAELADHLATEHTDAFAPAPVAEPVRPVTGGPVPSPRVVATRAASIEWRVISSWALAVKASASASNSVDSALASRARTLSRTAVGAGPSGVALPAAPQAEGGGTKAGTSRSTSSRHRIRLQRAMGAVATASTSAAHGSPALGTSAAMASGRA